MQQIRGTCPICNQPVTTAQPRELDENGKYCHSACVQEKLSAQGLTQISAAELEELKALAEGRPAPSKTAQRKQTGGSNPFSFIGNMFGSSAPSGPEMPDLPTSASSPPSMLDRMQQSTQAPPTQQKVQGDNWEMAYDPASGAPYWYKVSTGESTWENPFANAPAARPTAKPAAQQPATRSAASVQLPQGQRIQPQAGMPIPSYWQEGNEYLLNKNNVFEMGEIVAILRSDGEIRFGYIVNVNAKKDISGKVVATTTYDVQVDKSGSFYQGRYADSIYKITYDVRSVGIVLETQSNTGWI
ncbi:hypothetical protein GUITHDRAFT_152729 [Guillardia theta CCMP2712]|uniref:WW domain-containing protein n=1 Tax=Guillardia theta (strain CCMP2712) TaxID=905079 RepID=L1JBI6_GUITC|nr:hypothetical protein GUITHDRAFT_152729 [Guillardia theta CCMP2712]EKX45484.1 hypothetical protein GUITHDRAFT_152729 [Guillardia theta CCMP2712]|eukprot:XP_005832464.1 hypothetical protein GUITHDRAFT_152729 [Guillardia theta CCMP2712]